MTNANESNNNTDAIGILLPNSYDSLVPELTKERLMGAIPFAGSYRVVDFLLSSMVNSEIENVEAEPTKVSWISSTLAEFRFYA